MRRYLPFLLLTVGMLAIGIIVFIVRSIRSQQGDFSQLKHSPVLENPEMVLIPAGTFIMGGKTDDAYPDEFPKHEVEVSSFYLDKYEVTNEEFSRFVKATGYVTTAEKPIDWEELKKQLPPGTPKPTEDILQPGSLVFKATDGPVDLRDYSAWWIWTIHADWKHPEGIGSDIKSRMQHPVVHISMDDAMAYAGWLHKRLPTEAEWEWAASGGVGNKYPWGNKRIEDSGKDANYWQGIFPYQNNLEDGYFGTAPVGSFGANEFGLFDMAGNVWEWCSDRYNKDSYAEDAVLKHVVNPKGPAKSYDPDEPLVEKFILRGGSFLCNESYCSGYRVTRRMKSSRDSGYSHTGFRCAKD